MGKKPWIFSLSKAYFFCALCAVICWGDMCRAQCKSFQNFLHCSQQAQVLEKVVRLKLRKNSMPQYLFNCFWDCFTTTKPFLEVPKYESTTCLLNPHHTDAYNIGIDTNNVNLNVHNFKAASNCVSNIYPPPCWKKTISTVSQLGEHHHFPGLTISHERATSLIEIILHWGDFIQCCQPWDISPFQGSNLVNAINFHQGLYCWRMFTWFLVQAQFQSIFSYLHPSI